MGGASTGGGAVIGARSIVTKSIPKASLAVGRPARIIRTKTSWTRSANPAPQDIEALRQLPFNQPDYTITPE